MKKLILIVVIIAAIVAGGFSLYKYTDIFQKSDKAVEVVENDEIQVEKIEENVNK